MDVKVFYNFLDKDELIYLNNIFTTLQYKPEKDHPNDPPVGYTGKIPDNIVEVLHNKVSSLVSTDKYSIQRCYVNVISNTDIFKFHTDYSGNINAKTCLIYANLNYNIDHYGETIFLDGEESKVIFPSPGSMIWFDSKIPHCPRSFNKLRSDPRFTIAIKYLKNV